MSELLVIVPTRGRPDSAARLIQRFSETEFAQLALVIDADDPKFDEYHGLEGDHMMLTAPRMRPGIVDPLNWSLSVIELPLYVGFMGDDHLPRGNWADQICRELDFMQTGIVYGDDLLQGEALATAAFMTSDIVEVLGYMAPPELAHLWVDNYWMALGRGIDRLHYLSGTVIEHLHPLNGKSQWDPTYEQCNNPNAGPDRAAFELMQQNGRLQSDIEKVKGIL